MLTAGDLYGSATPTTCGDDAPRFATRRSTSAFVEGVVILAPSGARTTTRALAPSTLASGNFSVSRSKASCDSVPGIENVSAGGAGADEAATPAPAKTSSQSSSVTPLRRKASRPSLERNVATVGLPLGG